MNVEALLQELRAHHVKLNIKGDKLVCELPKTGIPDSLKTTLISNKEALKSFLNKLYKDNKKRHTIQKVDKACEIPLSFSQQSLYLAQKFASGNEYYNSHFLFDISGEIDFSCFQLAVRKLIERHEILRTCYGENLGMPFQFVMPMESIDMTKICELVSVVHKNDEEIEAQIRTSINIYFDLERDAPIRVKLFRTKERYLVLFVIHHIATDGFSGGVCSKELCQLYLHAVEKSDESLAPLDIQYADYAFWQRSPEWMEMQNEGIEYWLERLEGAPKVNQLPYDFPRPRQLDYSGRTQQFKLDSLKLAKLKKLAAREETTLFMLLHGLLGVLIAKVSGQYDNTIGAPIANRLNPQLESLIGFFVNTLPTRVQIDAKQSLIDILRQNKTNLLNDFSHQEVPIDVLISERAGERLVGGSNLFQVLFVMQNTPEMMLEFADTKMELKNFDAHTVRFDIELHITELNDELNISWMYATALFKEETIKSLHDSFILLIDTFLNNPEINCSDFSIVNKKQQIQLEKLQTKEAVPLAGASVQEAFESTARDYPESIALVDKEETISYGSLNAQANKLAHYLIETENVKPGDLVAFLVPRGIDQIITLMAILKAGAGYIPIDEALPLERIDQILQNYPNSLLIYGACSQACISEHNNKRQLSSLILSNYPVTNPVLEVGLLESPCYVLHTSGSTGKPKAVQMSHKALLNLIVTIGVAQPLLTKQPTWLQYASIGFDMSFTDIFMALSNHGKLVLTRRECMSDLDYLSKTIVDHDVSVLNLPHSMLHILLSYWVESHVNPAQLNCVISTAEQLKITPAIRKFFSRNNRIQLVNHYGPTETHVVTALNLSKVPETWADIPNIGSPIANVSCLVLDEFGYQVPVGAMGELYITGACLADQYLGEPELTKEKFTELPHYPHLGERFYRTGDLVRWTSNGNLEYLGRSDQQVKLRGFRVELSEVETTLALHPDVDMASVKCDEFNGDSKLIAYFTVKGRTPSQTELNEFLLSKLPYYMCPSLFIEVTSFTFNINGKVDKNALPKADFSVLESHYSEPETPTEYRLQGAWQSLLNVEKVGRNDNFFNLGGHSLLASQLSAGIQQETGIKLSVKTIMEAPILREQARLFDELNYLQNVESLKAGQTIKEEGVL
ncbi:MULTISPECIES: non-ribosomal peptide synthetase [unclassified Pseudoalteromonas]|uniref:non-ribosomal peptide synthetase n=1 Tax=unclassified Pseudoalteromonas TaxID=194690 RepID=UPI000C7A4EBC|nr:MULTISPECIES: non-ribosomal peptide synthetase [unclassified Pseudoalteromonas]AUJ68497.1 Linear gramicidin synthase subunit D [Pseudoalteromonas sp. NC201]MCX2769222.1 non-ribosomal peptide synthetase [Pseudoalteromonas sp. B530]